MKDDLGTVYLIHFNEAYKGCRHYIGWTGMEVEKRMKYHRGGRGACLLRACSDAGIKFNVVRTWDNKPFTFEQQLKKIKNAKRFCPICNPKGYTKYYQEENGGRSCSSQTGGKTVDVRSFESRNDPDGRSRKDDLSIVQKVDSETIRPGVLDEEQREETGEVRKAII